MKNVTAIERPLPDEIMLTAEEIAELARYIEARVLSEFGIHLQPEPVPIGLEL